METLKNAITRDIEERSRAIYVIERVFFTGLYNFNNRHKEVLLIHTIPILYSLWEGFIQHSFQSYIDWLNRQPIRYEDLKDSIAVTYVEKCFPQFNSYPSSEPKKNTKKRSFFRDLNFFFAKEKIAIPRVVNTESNVSFNVLNGLLLTYSLEVFPEYYKQYTNPTNLKSILDTFLRYRNGIAHGGDVSSEDKITHDTFVKYKDLVLFLMAEVESRIINGAENNSHLL
jgi:hypothetical protein